MENNASKTDELLEKAIEEAFEKYSSSQTSENVDTIETFVRLQSERDKNKQDYYVKATEIDNETQKIDDQEKKDKEDAKLINILKRYIPEFIKSGISSLTLLGGIIIIRRFEEKGYLIKFGELIKFFRL